MYAYWYLRRCGYVMVACLFMAPGIKGEIDLDGDGSAVLVLVGGEDAPGESPGFGKPENAVTPEKRRNLARRARHFLAERRIREAAPGSSAQGCLWCQRKNAGRVHNCSVAGTPPALTVRVVPKKMREP